ncbi:MAG: 4Fe-4S dicluster domain-containing protein [Proteobacteria bacterium]|nr:4Fe-4S dicluster domain-containing protein [Pseudomonadota bacterium]MBU4012661.1 4Fe-4S dicluster domain-containing protein [Pseudomonadota bacterium]MBU4066672.1 4Fe-4S dicluster domain-containing protein [Pseudomonadota bacterium]MBU4100738.1 4Fe-4S dicluster domain-containing protein [Pseudomonadota bacterium]MBU4126088.1 4Fe-4S dicluster domain-containing protein [Pseudomonadota bacterium]
MTMYAILETNNNPSETIRSVLKNMLSEKLVDVVLVPFKTEYSSLPMPTLIADPEKMLQAQPLAPAAPFNAARQAASVLRYPTGKKVAVVLRPCEIRALIELAKLKQCVLDEAILIGFDCMGRIENDSYLEMAAQEEDITTSFYADSSMQDRITGICKACEYFQPYGADLTICLLGMPVMEKIGLMAGTEAGENIIKSLGLSTVEQPEGREVAANSLLQKRTEARDKLFSETSEKIKDIEKFQKTIANCLNCYNCRNACPVCYCKECVFLTDVFAHEPEVLQRRAAKRGAVKLPADTTMFHMTRLAHMSHACVGCGQCSSVCPSSIPVADIFRTVSAKVQELYNYVPGRDISESIPYLVFEEESSNGK